MLRVQAERVVFAMLTGDVENLLTVTSEALTRNGIHLRTKGRRWEMKRMLSVFLLLSLLLSVCASSQAVGDAAVKGANDFAFRLTAELIKDGGDRNLICSPFSVWLPLVALVGATKEPQKTELLAALNASGLGEAALNRAVARMLFDLTNEESLLIAQEYGQVFAYDPLTIANAIFVNRDLTLNRDFSQTFTDYYRGSTMVVDFASPETVHTVNRWASQHTEGLISEIVRRFPENMAVALANAIYFSDRWAWEFSPEETVGGVFHAPQGKTDAFFMLREGPRLHYYEDGSVQAMPLAFETGGGMLILLPKDGDAAGLLAGMTDEVFQGIVRHSNDRPGKLLLPRFSIGSGVTELTVPLTALGVSLFDSKTAPLTGLVEEDAPVWISSVSHTAVIEVDEKGTTAAVVTMVGMAGAAPPDPAEKAPFEMICDRPFAFVLFGETEDGGYQVLFTGIVNQP